MQIPDPLPDDLEWLRLHLLMRNGFAQNYFCLFTVPANGMNLKESNPRWKDQLLNREVKKRLPLII